MTEHEVPTQVPEAANPAIDLTRPSLPLLRTDPLTEGELAQAAADLPPVPSDPEPIPETLEDGEIVRRATTYFRASTVWSDAAARMRGKVTLLRYHAAQGLLVVQRRRKERKEWMAFCKEEGLGYRTVYDALRLAEAVDNAVAEGGFRPEDLAKYGWNQALRKFGVKTLKQTTAKDEGDSDGAAEAETEETAPASPPVANSTATSPAKPKRKSGGGSRRAKRQGKGNNKEAGEAQERDGQREREKDNDQVQEKKLPSLPHVAAEKEVGLAYPPRELVYQCWYVLQDVAGRVAAIDWKQEDVDDWRNSISEMRDSLQKIEAALKD